MTVPHPVAACLRAFRSATEPSARLEALLLTVEVILRVDALLLAGLYARSGPGDDRVRGLLLKRSFSLGDWHALLQSLVSLLPGEQWKELAAWVPGSDSACPDSRFAWCRDSRFQTLLAIRNRKAHNLNRIAPDFIQGALEAGECCLNRILESHPPFGSFDLDGEERLVYRAGGTAYEAGPLLRPLVRQGRLAELFLYEGAGTRALQYVSLSGETCSDEAAFRSLAGSVREHLSELEPIDSRASPHLLHTRMKETTRRFLEAAWSALRLREESAVPRPGCREAFALFEKGTKRILLVHGPSGAGKTVLLAQEASRRLAAGSAVLFVPASRLGPEGLAAGLAKWLGVQGTLETALERLRGVSADGSVHVILDDLDAEGFQLPLLNEAVKWAERLEPGSPVRFLLGIRSENMRLLEPAGSTASQAALPMPYEVPPLSRPELEDLSGRLTPVTGIDDPREADRRRSLVSRLAESRDTHLRRPGLARLLLARVLEPEGDFSVDRVYDRLMLEDVLHADPSGRPSTPAAFGRVATLARALLDGRQWFLPLDRESLWTAGFLDGKTGKRGADYERLLASEVLVEKIEAYETVVGFALEKFFEFTAAADLASRPGAEPLAESLWEERESYRNALAVLSFTLIRQWRSGPPGPLWERFTKRPEQAGHLLFELALLDGKVFADLLRRLAESAPGEALATSSRLLEAGELWTGRAAALLLADSLPPPWREEGRLLLARALFELDEYPEAIAVLDSLAAPRGCRPWLIRGEVEAAREQWEPAIAAYGKALESAAPEDAVHVAHARRGLGYVLAHTGRDAEAEACFQRALVELEAAGSARYLAEAWCDFGEWHLMRGRRREARACLVESRRLNESHCCVVGVGIATGLLGELAFVEGSAEEAEALLTRALAVAEMTGNLWRQARDLESLAQVFTLQGKGDRAALCRQRAHSLRLRLH